MSAYVQRDGNDISCEFRTWAAAGGSQRRPLPGARRGFRCKCEAVHKSLVWNCTIRTALQVIISFTTPQAARKEQDIIRVLLCFSSPAVPSSQAAATSRKLKLDEESLLVVACSIVLARPPPRFAFLIVVCRRLQSMLSDTGRHGSVVV